MVDFVDDESFQWKTVFTNEVKPEFVLIQNGESKYDRIEYEKEISYMYYYSIFDTSMSWRPSLEVLRRRSEMSH